MFKNLPTFSADLVSVITDYLVDLVPQQLFSCDLPFHTLHVLISPHGDVWFWCVPATINIRSPDGTQKAKVTANTNRQILAAAQANRCAFDPQTGDLFCVLADGKRDRIVVFNPITVQETATMPILWPGRVSALECDGSDLYALANDGTASALYRVRDRDAFATTRLAQWKDKQASRLALSEHEVFALVHGSDARWFSGSMSQIQVFDKQGKALREIGLGYAPLSLPTDKCIFTPHSITDIVSDREGNLLVLYSDNTCDMHSTFSGERLVQVFGYDRHSHVDGMTSLRDARVFIDNNSTVYRATFPSNFAFHHNGRGGFTGHVSAVSLRAVEPERTGDMNERAVLPVPCHEQI